MSTKERRKNSLVVPYLFFLFEIIVIFEISYIYTNLFGTSLLSLAPLSLMMLYAFYNAVSRLSRVIQRIRFSNYNFATEKKKNYTP